MITSTINLTIFIIMIIIYLNEMKNISMFIFNFNYIKDFSKIIMEQKCNNIYCEAETDRYNIAKNSYKLLLPNDIFNSKTYIIFVFILSILIYIYYYYKLISDILELDKNNILKYIAQIMLQIGLFAIILGMIIARYVPTEDEGYLNYFKNIDDRIYIPVGVLLIGLPILGLLIFSIKTGNKHKTTYIIIPCFMLSFILLLNLLNMVLTFKNNTKPILKTKELLWSLNNSLTFVINTEEALLLTAAKAPVAVAPVAATPAAVAPVAATPAATPAAAATAANVDITTEKTTITDLKNKLTKGNIKTKENIQYVLNMLNAYSELLKIKAYSELLKIKNKEKDLNDTNKAYINKLKTIIDENKKKFDKSDVRYDISEISLIYDKEVKIPNYYNDADHRNNANSYNDEYKYTADISYDNLNLFYEKYWNINDKINGGIPQFLLEYSYFTPPLFFGDKPNLYKILILVIVFIVTVIVVYISKYFENIELFVYISKYFENIELSELYNILLPLITFAILIIYIIIFICFNTWFNKYVVYKCLDCSYKRSLNKLNNIVTPYIRLYDNKIIKGNKNYTHHYIISNVFYSILCGYIKLNNDVKVNINSIPINENKDNKEYYDVPKIKSNNLKFGSMNSNILNNDNEFREYYKDKFNKDVYNTNYTVDHANSVYNVFPHIFGSTLGNSIVNDENINTYFETIINKSNITKIFKIIKRCLILFEENKFNNNLIYYNDMKINEFNNFKFYKDNDSNKIIPYKFILKLTTYKDFEDFIKLLPPDVNNKIDAIDDNTVSTVLNDNNDISQASDMEKEQDNYLIKIIAKYLLIIGHININSIEYKKVNNDATDAIKNELDKGKKIILSNELNIKLKNIYELKTSNLYKFFSNTLYKDTYEINDTFKYINKNLIITKEEYRNLTYIYNFLETKYVSISSNDNNNYLANIIKGINNKINNDDKIFINNNKNAQYIFRDKINEIDNPKIYEDDQEILNVANNVSTNDFAGAYVVNMLILIIYYFFILKK